MRLNSEYKSQRRNVVLYANLEVSSTRYNRQQIQPQEGSDVLQVVLSQVCRLTAESK